MFPVLAAPGHRATCTPRTSAPSTSPTGPFATALVDVAHDTENGAHEHELRVRAACEQLAEQGAPDEVVTLVRERLAEPLDRPAPLARLVVAERRVRCSWTRPPASRSTSRSPPTTCSPTSAPWVAHRDGAVTFVLTLVDHEGGTVALYDSDVPDAAEETEAGGGGALRAQGADRGLVGAALPAQHRERLGPQRRCGGRGGLVTTCSRGHRLVLLAGDPRSRGLVRDRLADSQAEVVELESGTRAEDGGDAAMAQAIREALLDVVVRRRLEVVHELRQEVGRGGAAASGIDQVAEALVKGQVATLVLDPAALAEERIDPADHVGLAVPAGLPDGEVRADLLLVAAAVLTDADLVAGTAATLQGAPVAALLRWEERPGGAAPADEV